MLRLFSTIALAGGLTSFFIPNNKSVIINSCILNKPDTSVAGIKLRNEKSTVLILGKHTKLEGDSTHRFYSKNKEEVLSLTVHPGDYYSQVSIFEVSYSGKYKTNYRQTKINSFETEKGIHLGILKAEVVNKLGKCYSSGFKKNTEILTYRIENPRDSKTKLLERYNMPIYYAIYNFKNERLVKFEFGFEYP